MEEQQERRNVGEIELEGGQPSRNSGQTGLEPEEHRIDIVEISHRVKNWIESLKKAEKSTQSQRQWRRIPKVPQLLRGTQDFKKLYEPRVISIGPYHHGKPHLRPVQMIKPLCARNFLADSKQEIEALYTKIESNIEAVRKCYNKRPTIKYDNEALAWMMLLDGCFILQFICSRVDPGTVDTSDVLRNHQISFVEQDLFLLENQLPFGVLELIFEGAKFNDGLTMENMIKTFITLNNGTQLAADYKEPSHLLDLLRSALLGNHKKSSKQEVGIQLEQEQQPEKKGKSSSSQGGDGKQGERPSSFRHIMELKAARKRPSSFRHIMELKAAGIRLKPSTTRFLTDISFKSDFFCGHLKLPTITIDDSTKPKFLNMVAYEMCSEGPDDYGVTSYICFLDNLIDHPDDVKELRSNHILYNHLGSDEDVAKLFNEITYDLGDSDAYRDVKANIQDHYDERWNTWIAEGFHDYFRSPWTVIGFIVAFLLLCLTGLQTYYAHPGKGIEVIYMWLSGVAIILFVVWYIVRRLWD